MLPQTTRVAAAGGARYRNNPYAAPVVLPPMPHLTVPRSGDDQPHAAAGKVASQRFLSPLQPAAVAALVPASPVGSQPAPFVAINHKRDVRQYHNHTGLALAPGDCVIVDGDRGVDIGVVSRLIHRPPPYPVPLGVLRAATPAEAARIADLRQTEEHMCAQVQAIADAAMGPGTMTVREVALQFDGNKMTIFFESKEALDFRQLQRVLFSKFSTRIWLKDFHADASSQARRRQRGRPFD